MWRTCGEELVAQFLGGHNGTLLAYGQTGSGKTYTMGTDGACYALGSVQNPSLTQLRRSKRRDNIVDNAHGRCSCAVGCSTLSLLLADRQLSYPARSQCIHGDTALDPGLSKGKPGQRQMLLRLRKVTRCAAFQFATCNLCAGVTAFGEERLGMLPRVLRRVFEHVAAAEREGTEYQERITCP